MNAAAGRFDHVHGDEHLIAGIDIEPHRADAMAEVVATIMTRGQYPAIDGRRTEFSLADFLLEERDPAPLLANLLTLRGDDMIAAHELMLGTIRAALHDHLFDSEIVSEKAMQMATEAREEA